MNHAQAFQAEAIARDVDEAKEEPFESLEESFVEKPPLKNLEGRLHRLPSDGYTSFTNNVLKILERDLALRRRMELKIEEQRVQGAKEEKKQAIKDDDRRARAENRILKDEAERTDRIQEDSTDNFMQGNRETWGNYYLYYRNVKQIKPPKAA